MKRRLYFLFLVPVLLTAPLFAVPEPTAKELTTNGARLKEWRKDPEQMTRLRDNVTAFLSLPLARQEQVLQLDYDLHQEKPPTQTRLLSVLERYSEWRDHLPEADRQAIDNASNQTRRLTVIRGMHDEEWMRSQPNIVRNQWNRLAGNEKGDFLRKARLEDRQRRQQWASVRRFWNELDRTKWRPVRVADLDNRDQEGVKEYLMPMLSEEEKQLLTQAEGHWPAYPVTLVELADRHPLALPGKQGPSTFDKLPKALQSRFNAKIQNPFAGGQTHASALKQDEGSWPKFAVMVAKRNKEHMGDKPLPRELWAYDFKNLQSPMQNYVEKVLRAVLTSSEQEDLLKAEGQWPLYPEKIQDLVKRHALPEPPWETALYGPRERWDDYRIVKTATPSPTPASKRQD